MINKYENRDISKKHISEITKKNYVIQSVHYLGMHPLQYMSK